MINPLDPVIPEENSEGDQPQGLTKIEYFSLLILQGLVANPNETTYFDGTYHNPPEKVAVGYAQNLIAELNKLNQE